MSRRFGGALPHLATEVPGPKSRAWAERLAAVESRNITRIAEDWPVFWTEARGANVRDADGNRYVDLTGAFGVAAAGHANPRVAEAIARQAAALPHGMGDVHPPAAKVRLLERLAELAPGALGVSILASAGAEAVEAALKTALLHTGRPGVVAFRGGYHGLTYGALAATWHPSSREPFEPQLYDGVRFAPYPSAADGDASAALSAVRRAMDAAERTAAPVGAVLLEPLQGRGGVVVPPDDFLPGLRTLCDERGAVLIFDEVYTGFGRTGRWFACEHAGVVPDILTVGKALTGALPLSAAIGTPDVMPAWPPSAGEAIHTSTFLGNPIGCAAGLAQLEEIEGRGLVNRAAALGERLGQRLDAWRERFRGVAAVRGRGLMRGAELARPASGEPAAGRAARVVESALRRGVIVLPAGPHGAVLSFTPPLVISERQLDHALDAVEDALAATSRG